MPITRPRAKASARGVKHFVNTNRPPQQTDRGRKASVPTGDGPLFPKGPTNVSRHGYSYTHHRRWKSQTKKEMRPKKVTKPFFVIIVAHLSLFGPAATPGVGSAEEETQQEREQRSASSA